MKTNDLSIRIIDPNKPVVIFLAKKVITMNPDQPSAEVVAVQGDTIVGVGKRSRIEALLNARKIKFSYNEQFKDAVIYPGFAEHHMHPQMLGGYLLGSNYVGYVDRKTAEGGIMPGITSVEALVKRLKELVEQNKAALESGEMPWLNCWGYDPLLLDGADLTRDVLDQVTTDYPICIAHASGHVININSKAIEISGYEAPDFELADDINLFRYDDGRVNGTIAEPPLMGYAFGKGAAQVDYSVEGMIACSEVSTKVARINGCTSVTDKGTNISFTPAGHASEAWLLAKEQNKLHTRVNLEPWYQGIKHWSFKEKKGWDAIEAIRAEYDPRLSIGNLKLLTDGSIQGFTAHLLPDQPYYSGAPNGALLMSHDEIKEQIEIAESHGMSASIHTNGNGATEAVIQAVEEIRSQTENAGFRHQLEHCQMATENQFYRMAKNDMTANLFSNHMYYWADAHEKFTAGPHGVRRMDACRSAQNHGLIHGVHSDDMVTEVAPLFSAWCAVNRKSLTGVVHGEDQCLTVDEAMRVITYNHAYLAHQEDVRGSIEIGKWADFTVLAEEVTEEKRETFKDIAIIGTVIGGDDIFIN